jgi:arginine/lysine/ornithine decarboxylase
MNNLDKTSEMDFNANFYKKIRQYGEDNTIHRFHMPGHKGNEKFFGTDIAAYDVTETEKTDNLFFPKNELIEAEQRAARLFGVKRTVFLAGGATLGNQTALSFFQGRKILFERNIHISALNAAMLLDIEPVFAYNGFDSHTGVVLPISPDDIQQKLDKEKDISAVFLTSPNYYGLCADIRSIKKICDKHAVKLIVDNSHGTHLVFSENCSGAPDYCSHMADITVDSAHKTLPSLTGAAMIHFNFEISREEICSHMLAFSSTSPSFLILTSLDYACSWCEKNKVRFQETNNKVDRLKKKLKSAGIHVIESDLYDPMRLCIAAKNASEIDLHLRGQGIISEMQTGNLIVFMFSPFNSDEDFSAIENALSKEHFERPDHNIKPFPETTMAIPSKTAFFGRNTETDVKKAVGKIAARAVIPYPPGVPILIPGELVTKENADFLMINNTKKVTVCEI